MLRLAALLVLGFATVAAPAAAQGGFGGGGGRGSRGMRRAAGSGMNPGLVAGPPAPAEMARIATLDSTQATRYSALYQRFMENSASDRESLRAFMRQRRDESGAASSDAPPADDMRALLNDLAQQQKTFNDVLKGFLAKGQWKAYDRWLNQHRNAAPRRDRRSAAGYGSTPSS